MGFPGSSAGEESACNADLGSIPGLGRSPGEGTSYPLQFSGLENSIDCILHWVAKWDMSEQLSLSDMTRCSRVLLVHFLPQTNICHFSKKPFQLTELRQTHIYVDMGSINLIYL